MLATKASTRREEVRRFLKSLISECWSYGVPFILCCQKASIMICRVVECMWRHLISSHDLLSSGQYDRQPLMWVHFLGIIPLYGSTLSLLQIISTCFHRSWTSRHSVIMCSIEWSFTLPGVEHVRHQYTVSVDPDVLLHSHVPKMKASLITFHVADF